MRILLIEDDKEIGENVRALLQDRGYDVDWDILGELGLEDAENNTYEVIILDWMLPDMNGDLVCQKIREKEILTPIIFLTAKVQIEDKVTGFNSGADDYLTKPFLFDELLVRIQALIRRSYGKELTPAIGFGGFELRTDLYQLSKNGKVIPLTPKLYNILEFLALNMDKVVLREDLFNHVWDENADILSNVVDVHIKSLRKLLGKKRIKTVKGKGYMLCSN